MKLLMIYNYCLRLFVNWLVFMGVMRGKTLKEPYLVEALRTLKHMTVFICQTYFLLKTYL